MVGTRGGRSGPVDRGTVTPAPTARARAVQTEIRMRYDFPDRRGVQCEVIPGFAATVFSGSGSGAGSGYFQGGEGAAGRKARIALMRGVHARVRLATVLLDALSPASSGDRLLVIGASHGEECLALAMRSASANTSVTGTNLTDLPVFSTDLIEAADAAGDETDPAARAQDAAGRVALVVDDITASGLEDESFDRVYSWQTFEHVLDPAAGLRHLARVLRPGGAAMIEYNPFFSIDGAHWPATIDIPWAHARMTDDAFERAVFTLHPDRQPDAASFVRRAINRATQAEMLGFARDAGLEILAHLPRLRTEDALMLTDDIIAGVRAGFPHATAADLTGRIVRLVLRRPERR